MKDLMNRIGVFAVFAVVGLVMLIVGLVFSTVARPDGTVRATLDTTAPYVVTHEGVLGLIDSTVTIEVEASNSAAPVAVALGNGDDMRAWLGDRRYDEVFGLATYTTLTAQPHDPSTDPSADPSADATASASASPSASASAQPSNTGDATAPSEATVLDSDMWDVIAHGTGSASTTYTVTAGQRPSILVASDGVEAAPKLTLTWHENVSIAWAIALAIVGGVMVVVFTGLIVWRLMRTRTSDGDAEPRRELAAQLRDDESATTTIEATVNGRTVALPSRRAMREARARGEAHINVGGRTFDTGLIPIVREVSNDEDQPKRRTPLANTSELDAITASIPLRQSGLPSRAQWRAMRGDAAHRDQDRHDDATRADTNGDTATGDRDAHTEEDNQ